MYLESRKFELLGTRDFIGSMESSNYREVNIAYITPKNDYHFFPNLTLCVKETSKGDFSFMHTKHVFI